MRECVSVCVIECVDCLGLVFVNVARQFSGSLVGLGQSLLLPFQLRQHGGACHVCACVCVSCVCVTLLLSQTTKASAEGQRENTLGVL